MADKTNGLGAMIKAMRRQADMTQADLAARVGMERTSICNIERGNQTLNVQTINAIAAALGYGVRVRFVKQQAKVNGIIADASRGLDLEA